MTVISEAIENVGGADNKTIFSFAAPGVREGGDSNVLITTTPITLRAVDGVLTTPDLDPGPAVVRVGDRPYLIEIPESDDPVRLWPLIAAALPIPPAVAAEAVRNFGGVAGIRRVTQSWYAANSHDPETLYVVIADAD